MVQTQDLRIGNYLLDRKNRICKVEIVNKQDFKAPSIQGKITSLPNKSIPLTEEWLLFFGAKWVSDYLIINLNNIEIRSFLPNMQGASYHTYFNGHHLKELFYVHELQNIIYALTKTELICAPKH